MDGTIAAQLAMQVFLQLLCDNVFLGTTFNLALDCLQCLEMRIVQDTGSLWLGGSASTCAKLESGDGLR